MAYLPPGPLGLGICLTCYLKSWKSFHLSCFVLVAQCLKEEIGILSSKAIGVLWYSELPHRDLLYAQEVI